MMMYLLLLQTCNIIMNIDRIIAAVEAILEGLEVERPWHLR